MSFKETIRELAAEIGFQRTVIGALDPLSEASAKLEKWLGLGYGAQMEWLKRDPKLRGTPKSRYPAARSVIIVSVSYYTEPPPDPGPGYGRVASYAVGLDYHKVLPAKLRQLKERVETEAGRSICGVAITDSAPLLELALAKRSGLGFRGKNSLLIGPYLDGSYNFVAELFTDLDLEPDEPYRGTCGQCFRCGDKCPTGAIEGPGLVNASKCISYLTIENKDSIPVELRTSFGSWVFGCDICQQVCPYNQRPPRTPWKEFESESGCGHYLSLNSILQIESDDAFKERFRQSAVRRAGLRGLLRNALVVIGNQLPEEVLSDLSRFAVEQHDSILREHAAWALSCYQLQTARKALELLYRSEVDQEIKSQIAAYL